MACDGGGGAAGHPKVFINTDKPEIATCGYCGLPFVSLFFDLLFLFFLFCFSRILVLMQFVWQANEHNRHHLESLPETSYPL